MTKQQALALSNALAANKIPHSIVYALDATNVDVWSAQLTTSHVYTGAEISTLANYCATNNLGLTMQFDTIGVV